jgi:1,2-diacylglycerol 3-alpha-glucosyltransferase
MKNLQEELTAKGHEVRLLSLSESSHSYTDGPIYYIRSMPIGIYPNVRMPLSYRHRLLKELIQWKPDVIHSQCEFFTMQFAKRISRKTGAPIIHTYHTMYERYVRYVLPGKRLGKKTVRALTRKLLKKTSAVVAPTSKMKEILSAYDMKAPIYVIPTGISLKQHKKEITEEACLLKRKSLGIAPDQPVMINLGRLGEEKNVDELLSFFVKAREAHPDLVFLIVGDGPARKDLEAHAEKLGIREHVIFTGMVEPSTVQEYYRLSDLFVCASTSEAQGLTYVEAAANKLPLLCRDDPCARDVITPGENGYLYTNEEEFLRLLQKMLADPEWRSRAGRKSAEIADTFDKSVFGERIEALYLEVLNQKRS